MESRLGSGEPILEIEFWNWILETKDFRSLKILIFSLKAMKRI
jgi:hypothetical protein